MEKPVILCVDDELFLLSSLEETLKRNFGQDYSIESATTAQEALEYLAELHQDNIDIPVIISDQAMPDMKGVDLLIRVHQQYPKTLTIMLTGQANAQDVGKALNHANLYRYISKPWEENDLILTVKEAVRSYFQEKSLAETNHILQQLNISLEKKVTERTAELEAAKQEAELANQVKSNFLRMISHELRTPLSAIIGFSQILIADKSLNQEHNKNAEIIYKNGEHLLILINDILSMSKLEKGRIALHNRQFDLHRFLHSIQDMMRIKASEKQLKLIFEYHDHLPQYVVADDTKLRQVLIHLIGNGIKFTLDGYISLNVFLETENKIQIPQQDWVNHRKILLHFQVKDTGVGIQSNVLETLFDPFIQTRKGETSEGTGLGLPISRELVQLMGGEITVKTEVGQGSIFEFEIPVEISLPLNQSAILQSENNVIGLAPNQPNYRILIWESGIESSPLIQQNLQEIGFDVREVSEVKEAILLWQNWQPHLIFMNSQFTQDKTITALISDHDVQDSLKPIIIAVSRDNDLSNQSKISLAGFNDILESSISIENILQKISQHLGVHYRYAESDDDPTHEEEQSAIANFNIEELRVMSLAWVQQFHEGTSQCNERLLYPLIDQIPTELENHANLLKELIHDFRYDLLLEIANQLLLE